MIKINLALKKQASYAAEDAAGKTSGFSLKSIGANSEELMSVLSQVFFPLILSCGVYFAFNYYIQLRTDEFRVELGNIDSEKIKIQSELKKIQGFEAQKNELEKTAQIINTKISTVDDLIRGKDHMLKSMIALSQSLPKNVWLTEINATDKMVNIRGSTLDMALVSDVMSKLGSSIYYKDVTLKGSTADNSGQHANFELTARRE